MWRRSLHICLVGLCLMGGCNHIPLAQEEGIALPHPRVQGRPRSIVCDSPKLHQLYEVADARTRTESPWYMSRNDARLATQAGYKGTTETRWVNVTYDRQSISGGRSRDYYHNTTWEGTKAQMRQKARRHQGT